MKRSHRGAFYLVALGVMLCGLAFGSSPAVVRSGAPPAAVELGEPASVGVPFVAGFGKRPGAAPQGGVEVMESGDPDAPTETLTINEAEVRSTLEESRAMSAFSRRQRQYKEGSVFAKAMLDLALDFANRRPLLSREGTPGQIRKFISLWGYQDESVPYCAMGLSYVAGMAYCDLPPARISYHGRNETKTFKDVLPLIKKYYFAPNPSCWYMMKEAQNRGAAQAGGWIRKGKKSPKPGYLVLFDWDGDGVPQHIGIVKAVSGRGTLSTVEFNTCIGSGRGKRCGVVAEKVRPMDSVIGFIRTY
jgi:CHAP domain